MLKFFLGFATAIVLAVAGGLFVMQTGVWSVAATARDGALVDWVLHSTMRRSVAKHAREIRQAEPSGDAGIRAGSEEYAAMCAGCHGAPGRMRSAAGKGLHPLPPDLAVSGTEWRAEELFWIVKNGIKMTGMPAFGPTHDDKTIWDIVAFVKALPDMSADQYQAFAAQSGAPGGAHEH